MAWYAWFRHASFPSIGSGSGEVSGVKGSVETTYRKGNVNLDLPNITNLDGGLQYNNDTKTLSGAQYTEMPQPSAIFGGRIVQYVGQDSASYSEGHFYKCKDTESGMQWEEVPIAGQELTPEQVSELLSTLD